MSAELLKRAAGQIRADCPIPAHGRELDFVDYPTGWALQRAGLTHTDELCSAAQTGGAMLCDCPVLLEAWRRWRTLLLLADHLESARCSLHCEPDGSRSPYCSRCEDSGEDHHCPDRVLCEHSQPYRRALAMARAYLPESPA